MNKILRVGVSAALLGYLAWHTDWQHVAEAFAQLRLRYWLGAVALLVLAQLVSAWRWQLMARALGLTARFGQLTGYYFIGMFFNLVLPTSVGGDVVRACYLTGSTGKRLPAFVSVLVDRVNGFMVLLGLACASVALVSLKLPTWIPAVVWGTSACGVLGLVLFPFLVRFGKNGSEREQKVRTMLEVLRQPRVIAQTALLSLLIQVANVVLVWLVGLALQAPIPWSFYWILVPMVSVLTLVPVSLNGMGVREGGTALLLAPLGVPQATALSLAFLWFAVHVSVSLMGGLVYLFGYRGSSVAYRLSAVGQEPEIAGRIAEESHGSFDRDSDQGRAGQLEEAA